MKKSRVFPNKMDVLEAVYEWHEEIHPIIVDPYFANWVETIAEDVRTSFLKQRLFRNVSDITFSILCKGKFVNPSRFAIGTTKVQERKRLFLTTVRNFIGEEAYKDALNLLKLPSIYLIQLGIDVMSGEKKFYIYYYDRRHPIIGITYDFKGNKIESKIYKNYQGETMVAKTFRGARKQVNYNLTNKANQFRVVKRLPISLECKLLAFYVLDKGYNLDTVSFSKKRGIGLYFD